MKVGFDYYNVDTDRYQDKRIKRLKKNFGCSGIAVYDYILCEIYRVKGCFLEWDESTAFDVADYLALKEQQVGEIVNYCCHVGLFDKELLASESVLSSISIQTRYIGMSKRAKRQNFNIPETIKLSPEESRKLQEEIPKVPEVFHKGKESKGEERRGDDETPPPKFHPDSITTIETLTEECLSDRINFVEHIYRQLKIDPKQLPVKLKQFNDHLKSIGELTKTKKDYRIHFMNWARKQPISTAKKMREI